MSYLEDLEFRYSDYDTFKSATVAEELRLLGWGPHERWYNDAKYDTLVGHFREDMQEEYAKLSDSERREVLQVILDEVQDELEDDYVEKRAGSAIAEMVLVSLIEKELASLDETSQSIAAE